MFSASDNENSFMGFLYLGTAAQWIAGSPQKITERVFKWYRQVKNELAKYFVTMVF